MDKILTISLTTYNRKDTLKKQLSTLLLQLNDEVELIIRDNCSNESVRSYFPKDYLEKVTIIRNTKNIGADLNIARGFESCKTKWLWTLSDDDILLDNAVATVLEFIKQYPDAAWINLNTDQNKKCIGFYEFANSINTSISFGTSFWITTCIYNITELQSSLIYYFNNTSSMIGTLYMLLKHSENNPNTIFIKSTKKITYIDRNSFCKRTWEIKPFIYNSSIIFFKFKKNKYKFLRKNVLKYLIIAYFSMIGESFDISKKEKMYIYKYIIDLYGIYYIIKNTPRNLTKSIITSFFPILIKYRSTRNND
jgi:glycosyltransferase involved in cell wall biosynthesis